MAGTKPAGETQYAASSMSSDPGKREKVDGFDTSVGSVATTVSANATVNECAAAQEAVIKAQRAVASRATGLAKTVESGYGVLSLTILDGGTAQSASTAQAATGGSGSGLTITTTVDAGVVDSVAVVAPGRGYVVGDVVTRVGATFTVTEVA